MLSTEWLSAFAPMGVVQEPDRWAAFGACVFFAKDNMVWVITAGHVIDKIAARPVTILLTRSGGGVSVFPIGATLAQHGLSWVRDQTNDLAAAPMPMSREIEIKSIPVQLCLPFKDLLPSMPCFTIGCPYGLHGVDKQRSTPLVLDGVISGVDPEAKRIYTSTPTFPGNSGGPLIAVRGSVSNDGRQMIIGRSPVLLAGIMLETRLVFSPDPAVQTPPLHLGFAVPMDAVISLLDAKEVQAIVTRFAPKA